MRAAHLALTLAATAALPGTALGYEQTCPNGNCIRWNRTSIPWKLNVTRSSTAPNACDADVVEGIVQASFAPWQAASAAAGAIAVPYGGRTTSKNTNNTSTGEHIVVFRAGWCSQNAQAVNDACFDDGTCGSKYGCFDDGGDLDRHTLAVTLVKYIGTCIIDADVEVADWSGTNSGVFINENDPAWGWYWSCVDPQTAGAPSICDQYGDASCFYQDLQNTLTHEAGHFLGLAHPCEFGGLGGAPACPGNTSDPMWATTMFPTAPPGETRKRDLATDDIDGIRGVYPTGFTPDADACPSMETSSGCGCGGGPAGGAAALLGLAALAPRWRRRSSGSR